MTSDILQLIHGGTLPFKPGFRRSSLMMKVYHRGSPINGTLKEGVPSVTSPRQSFPIRRWENKLKSCFFRGHVRRKKHFSARQCGLGSSFDPRMHAAGCISSKKCWHFFDMLKTPGSHVRAGGFASLKMTD